MGISWSAAAEAVVEDFSGGANPDEPEAPVGSEATLRRNSVANADGWRRRLDAAQIARIRRGVEDVSPRFYSDADW